MMEAFLGEQDHERCHVWLHLTNKTNHAEVGLVVDRWVHGVNNLGADESERRFITHYPDPLPHLDALKLCLTVSTARRDGNIVPALLEELRNNPKLYKTGAGRLVLTRLKNQLWGQKDKTIKARLLEQARKLGKGFMFRWLH